MKRVALISMPFAAVDYPSLALGLFKSRLDREGIESRTFYFNIDFARLIGAKTFTDLIVGPPAYFAPEQLFAEACFGLAVPSDHEYYEHNNLAPEQRASLQAIKSQVEPFLNHIVTQVPWHDFDIIGFTSLFEQNLATLALARRLKHHYPDKTIVVGGPNFEDVMGRTFHRLLPFIDYVCSGEADDTFPELIKRLSFGHPVGDLPGIIFRKDGMTQATPAAPMISAMDDLPYPDFSDYFAQLQALEPSPGMNPCVLIETSRGCWWGEKNHCTFCGLNSQGMTYRAKSENRGVDEIVHMRERYGVNFVRVVDNILNTSFFDNFIPSLARKNLGMTIFFEVKANLKKQQVIALRDAGVTIVQAGIESLSTPVLKLMKKGSNALMNIQTLKWCKQYGVACDWNLLYGFPGEKPEYYEESLGYARLMSHLDPPTGCGPIRLDRFSPNYDRAREFGFKNVRAMDHYRFLYPFSQSDLDDVAYYFDFEYEQPIDDGGNLDALKATIAHWKGRGDQLYAVENGDAVTVHDTRAIAGKAVANFRGLWRFVFDALDSITTVARVHKHARAAGFNASETDIQDIIERLVSARLVAREENRYVGLTVLTYEPHNSGSLRAPPTHGVFGSVAV